MVRVTEAAAVAASKWIGRGDNDAADAAAVEAMREALNELPFDGTVVIGEGERDEAPDALHRREGRLGAGHWPEDQHRPRPARRDDADGEGRAERAVRPDHLRRRRSAQRARHLHGQAGDRPRLSGGHHRPLDKASPKTSASIADAKGVPANEIIACVLDRPRHEHIIDELALARLRREADLRRRRRRRDCRHGSRHRASTSILAAVARQKASLPHPRCAASAGRCRVV